MFTADISLTLSKKKNKAPSTVSTAIDSIGNVIALAGNHTNQNMLVKLHRESHKHKSHKHKSPHKSKHAGKTTSRMGDCTGRGIQLPKHLYHICLYILILIYPIIVCHIKKIINVTSADPEFYPASLWCPQEDYLIWGQVNIVFVVFSECRHCFCCFQ